jgi:hypothetical protein
MKETWCNKCSHAQAELETYVGVDNFQSQRGMWLMEDQLVKCGQHGAVLA